MPGINFPDRQKNIQDWEEPEDFWDDWSDNESRSEEEETSSSEEELVQQIYNLGRGLIVFQ